MDKSWEIKPRKYDDVILQLLYNRGVISQKGQSEKIEKFFQPNFESDMNDPASLPDCVKAVDRIDRAIKTKEKVGIFADYDADGIPGAAFLYKTLKKLNLKPEIYIPNREGGYGLSREGIDFLISQGCKLIITVDLGIRNIDEANYCRKNKIDLIITDHHLPGDKIPQALAVVNPQISTSSYPFLGLSGAGVIFKVIVALSKKYPEVLDQSFLKWNMDLIAISTIADVVPLTNENRVIAKFGLIVLNKTKNIGLSELYKKSALERDKLSVYSVAFQIAPRINAPGRIDHASKSFQLLTTEDKSRAEELSEWLNSKNLERQESMDTLVNEAVKKIEKNKLDKNNIIIVAGDWGKGILGPSASQIAEKYYKPIILFSSRGNVFSGSARSVEGVNIVEILDGVKKYLARYGGHKGAAGLAVEKSKFDKFEKSLIEYCAKKIPKEMLVKKVKIDLEIRPQELKLGLYDKVLRFEPFGLGNSKPVFILRNATMEHPRFVGRESKHLSSHLVVDNRRFKAIYFSYAADRDIIKHGIKCDAAFTLSDDTWNNERKLCLNVIDLKPVK